MCALHSAHFQKGKSSFIPRANFAASARKPFVSFYFEPHGSEFTLIRLMCRLLLTHEHIENGHIGRLSIVWNKNDAETKQKKTGSLLNTQSELLCYVSFCLFVNFVQYLLVVPIFGMVIFPPAGTSIFFLSFAFVVSISTMEIRMWQQYFEALCDLWYSSLQQNKHTHKKGGRMKKQMVLQASISGLMVLTNIHTHTYRAIR